MGARENIQDLLLNGTKENANKDSTLISTKKELTAGMASGEIYLDSLPSDIREAHKSGDIYIHDTGDRANGSINCCLFDMASCLDGGFKCNNIEYTEPTSVESAMRVMADVILHASSQQYGGFTVPEIDTVLAKYVRIGIKNSEEYYREHLPNIVTEDQIHILAVKYVTRSLKQGFQAIETRQNTISNANGQTTFFTVSFGLDTTPEGRLVSRVLLENRMQGLGKNHAVPIFPKLVFLHRNEINGVHGSPNYDLYLLALKCSTKMMYPDYESLDAGYVGEMFTRFGKAVSPMGCRAYLSPWYKRGGMHPADENDEPVFTGRANCGAVTLNTVRCAIEANGDKGVYFAILREQFRMATKVHLITYDRLSKVKAKSNPLFFCEGGCHIKLDPEDCIKPAIDTFTWSYGYIGLDEASYLMTGKHIHEDNSFAIEVLQKLNEWVDEAKKNYGLLFAIYGTPAESLCYSLRNKDFRKYGVIEGVTDKEYYMNSFHCDVKAQITATDKLDIEDPMFHLSNGGHIVYTEFPNFTNVQGLKQIVDYGMEHGKYQGVNIELDSCNACGNRGEFKDHVCTECGSNDILEVNRVCGYLGYGNRQNKGKIEEKSNRVDHFGIKA